MSLNLHLTNHCAVARPPCSDRGLASGDDGHRPGQDGEGRLAAVLGGSLRQVWTGYLHPTVYTS